MNAIFAYLWSYFTKHKLRYTVVVVFMLAASAMYVAPIYLLRLFIDAILEADFTWETLFFYGGLFLAAIAIAYVTEFVWNYFLFIGSYDMQSQLRGKIMGHFLKMRPSFYHRFHTGDLMTRANDDVQVMGMTIGYGLMVFLNTSVYLAFILGMMAITVSWKLTLVALVPMPFLAYFIFKWGSLVDAKFTKAQNAVSEMNSEVLEMIDGIRVVRAFGLEGATTDQFQQKTSETLVKNNEVSEIDSRFGPLITILLATSFVLSFGIGAFFVAQQEITIGAMVSFQVYLGMIVWPMISAGDLVNVMQQGAASWRRISEILKASDDLEPDGNVPLPELVDFRFAQFKFHYPQNERLVLKDIDLDIPKGAVIGIVGKTGSGKTTLLRQFGHYYPYSNQVPLVNDTPLTAYKTQDLRQLLAEVPQEHTLFSRSIRENLLFGNAQASDEELWQALETASFAKEVRAMPQGLNTLVGEKGVSLSGGQKQRLSLARAFLRKGELLLLDDALSAVDAKTEQVIIDNLAHLPKTPTMVIITHRLSAITNADQIIVLDEGRISQSGRHEDLIQTPGWYQDQYFHQQIKGGGDFAAND